MMQPKTTKLYIPQVDEVVAELVAKSVYSDLTFDSEKYLFSFQFKNKTNS